MNHKQLLSIGIKKRNKEIDDSWDTLAKKHSDGFFHDGEAYRLWVKNRVKNHDSIESDDVHNFKESIEINKDGSQSSNKLLRMSIDESKDVNYLLKSHGYDTEVWELISARNNIWNSYSKKDGIQTLYSSKISVKPRKDEFNEDTIRQVYADIARDYKSPTHSPTRLSESGQLLELSIADLHLGKLAWSGDANDTYNWQIARDNFFYIINDVLSRTSGRKFENILFVWSNDFFHYDLPAVTTTGGTKQDTDLKWSQLYKIGTQMLIEAIDLLSQHAPVQTFYVGSNHDKQMSFYATEHLAAWFRNDHNVIIDTDPRIRKYIEFGKNLIQFSHGHAEGKRIGDVMSVEAREAWGRTEYHEVHAGHFHSERTVTKDNGVIVRYLGSPSGTDTWHYDSGYVGAVKKGQSFIWDRERGLLDILYTTV